jgi:hypothetical protein
VPSHVSIFGCDVNQHRLGVATKYPEVVLFFFEQRCQRCPKWKDRLGIPIEGTIQKQHSVHERQTSSLTLILKWTTMMKWISNWKSICLATDVRRWLRSFMRQTSFAVHCDWMTTLNLICSHYHQWLRRWW